MKDRALGGIIGGVDHDDLNGNKNNTDSKNNTTVKQVSQFPVDDNNDADLDKIEEMIEQEKFIKQSQIKPKKENTLNNKVFYIILGIFFVIIVAGIIILSI